jgi:hypothetical protein
MDAFNSCDRTRIDAYAAKYEPSQNVDRTVAFRDQTGGFDLLDIDKSDRLHIEFRVKEKASPAIGLGRGTFKIPIRPGLSLSANPRHDRVRHEHKDRCRHAGARD